MGKYMRKGKGAGKVAVMEVSQGALGVRTRAKTLALVEHDRKLALARSSSSEEQCASVVGSPFHTTYLELRSRKLEKVVKEIEKPVRGYPSRKYASHEVDKNSSKVEGIMTVDEVACTGSEGEELVSHAEVVGSSRTPELSPRHVDAFRIFKDFPMEPALNPPRATLDGAQLRCSESAAGEESLRSGNVPPERNSGGSHACMAVPGGVSLVGDGLSQDGVKSGRPEVDASCEYVADEVGMASARRFFRGSPVTISSKDRERDSDLVPESVSRAGFLVDRRMANHRRIMNRRYMRTNLFSDAKAIDELFATPDNMEREDAKRFTGRYNYDVVNDKPLNGRYEWEPAVGEPCSTTTPTTQHLTDKQQQPIRS